MIELPNLTVVAATTKDHGTTITAILKTLDQIKPKETIFFTDVIFDDQPFKQIKIDRFRSVEDYNDFIFKKIADYISTSHLLVIQWDGYVIDASAWTDEFLQYDYIGAPWTYTDGRNVGNGGFSLRSRRLHQILQLPEFEFTSPEDEKICRYYRQTLEKRYEIKFAPEHIAHKFSFEMHRPLQRTFGFHNHFHEPYREPIILKRSGAMGDVIMLEPVMEWFYNRGHRIILDTPASFYNLFARHFFPIEHIDDVRAREGNLVGSYQSINFDMAYEVTPKSPVLREYYRVAGIEEDTLRNSRLNFKAPEHRSEVRMFDKYVIMHIDDTAMPHRNVHGVDWEEVANYIQVFLGYPVFRVGNGNGQGALKINTMSENMLGYIIGNANYFIGIDSGCGQIAVACGVKSMLFFGSVFPEYRYQDLSGIQIMQKKCPIGKDWCYHEVVSTVGKDCEVDIDTPPCITWKTSEVIEEIKHFIV